MITLKKTIFTHPDLFLKDGTATNRLAVLLHTVNHKLSLEELISEATEILNLEDTKVSEKKRKQYIYNFSTQKSKYHMQNYLKNIIMSGSCMSMNQF